MADVWQVLGLTWRRYWSNPMAWAWPFGAGAIVITAMFIVGSVTRGSLVLFLVVLIALAAYTGAGFVALWASITAGKRPVMDDFIRGGAKFFWRVAGLMLLFGAFVLCVSLVIAAVIGGGSVFRLGGYPAVSPVSALAPGLIAQIAAVLLFVFAPAAMGIHDLTTGEAIGRGLRFLASRAGLALGLIAAGFVITQVPGLIVAALLNPWFRHLAMTGALDPSRLAGVMASFLGLAIVLAIYSGFAMPFTYLMLFTGYSHGLPGLPETSPVSLQGPGADERPPAGPPDVPPPASGPTAPA